MAVGSVGQMVITNVLGPIALLCFALIYLPVKPIFIPGMLIGVMVCCTFFILFYFRISVLIGLLSKIKWLRKFKRFFLVLAAYQFPDLFRIFLLCLSRYLVFTTQYCLLIQLFIPELPLVQVAMMMFILFFIQSALPSLDLLDVGVRALTASYFFGYITHNEVAIIATTAFVWLVNLIIPAILGLPFIFKLNFFGNNRS